MRVQLVVLTTLVARLAHATPEDPTIATERASVRPFLTLFNQLAQEGTFTGTALVACEGGPVLARAYGLASREYRAPNRVSTRFSIGSLNKLFTQVAIAKLMERGSLHPSDTVAKLLPEHPITGADRITVEHLLDHRSGLGDIFGDEYFAADKMRFRTALDHFPLFASKPLLFEPGTSMRYSNAGYIVLGRIIEKRSGQSYDDFVREQVFQPAGMRSTAAFDGDLPIENVATGYTRRGVGGPLPEGEVRTNRYHFYRGSSAGGGYSTVEDLLKFARALEEGRLLSPPYTQWMLKGAPLPGQSAPPKPPMPVKGRMFGGGAIGLNAALGFDFLEDCIVVTLANADPPMAMEVADRLMSLVKEPSAPK
ncbi:serine hydrolase domain-containing protein [Myxococcus landrumensis]|uniref:Beta-lactamase family protein n=1 Tax=Myxococcus landrumensis TaxID=2813577 RepID=A0ABX7N2W0_9BACT|nr:serine hydrolase domain-containing protein [Myxococcus landrumus]QSQ13079.1 beta-lactamase family protein [Myxococcus landrumus]